MFSYAKMFEKSALATFLHFARVRSTHQPHVCGELLNEVQYEVLSHVELEIKAVKLLAFQIYFFLKLLTLTVDSS